MASHYKLLVYYDGSAESKSALACATRLGDALAASIYVLSVSDIDAAVCSSVGYLSGAACFQIDGVAAQVLKEAMDYVGDSGAVARGHVAVGNVVDSLLRYAALLDVDLLVLGHRNPRGLGRWWGQPFSHTEVVKRATGRAVMIVPIG